jgi:hypothetical protein
MKDWAKNALLAVGSVILTATLFGVGVEGVERVRYGRWKRETAERLRQPPLFVASADPALSWENQPGAVVGGAALNRWGYRDLDYATKAKPLGVRRVAFVGDSVTFGLNSDASDVFVPILGRQVRELRGDDRVQLMNFSVVGYDEGQVAELIRARVLGFAPDEVVYVLCLNDFDFGDFTSQLVHFFRPPKSFLWERMQRARRDSARDSYIEEYFAENSGPATREIGDVASLLARKTIGFQVAIVPVFDLTLASFRDYRFTGIHGSIQRLLRDRQVRVIDLLPYFRECAELSPAMYALDFWHLGELGHRFVAAALLHAALSDYLPEQKSDWSHVCAALKELEPRQDAAELVATQKTLSSGATVHLAIDSSGLVLRGLWPIERVEGRVYAWTRGTAGIRLRGLRPGARYRAALVVADLGGRSRIEVGPRSRPLHSVTATSPLLEVPDLLIADDAGVVDLELRMPTWRPSAAGSDDPRELGIALAGVELHAEDEHSEDGGVPM